MSKIYAWALVAVVILDTLCVTFLFPLIPRSDGSHAVGVGLIPAFIIVLVSSLVIGIALLEFGGKIIISILIRLYGMSPHLSLVLVKNVYATVAPILSAIALVLWNKIYPEFGFSIFFPDALIAGIILHYIDYGIVVPWSFKIAEALHE